MRIKFILPLTGLLCFFLVSCTLPLANTVTPPDIPTINATSTSTAISSIIELTPISVSPSTTASTTQTLSSPSPVDASTPISVTVDRYAVILVDDDDVLNIRSDASENSDITGQFSPHATNVYSAGQTAKNGENIWLQVENPSGGTGWVNTWYLTEYITSQDFCNDSKVPALMDKFKQAINDGNGEMLKALVSPVHGLEVIYWHFGKSANYSPAEASWVFDSTYEINWGSGPSGMDDIGTFSEYPLPALQEVLNDENLELRCNDATSASMYLEPWPSIYSNVNFYALYKPGTPGIDLDWATWLADIEYVEGEPYLFALIRFVWEP